VATRLARDHGPPRAGHHQNVKYWIKPDIENRIKNAEVTAYFNSSVLEIKPDSVRIKTPEGERVLKNDLFLRSPDTIPTMSFCGPWALS